MKFSQTRQNGITLVEVLVTLLIFTVGLLGLAGLQLKALQGASDSIQRSQATWIINDLADRIYANENATVADYTGAAPTCATLPVPACADMYNAATNLRVNGASCTATQMAAFDRWEASCKYRETTAYRAVASASETRTSGADFLVAHQIGLQALDTNADAINDSLALSLSWQGKGGATGSDQQSTQITVRK